MRMCESTCISTSLLFHIHIYNYHYVYMYTCDDYDEMTIHDMSIPITIRLCVPADRGFARCLHTCDPMFKGLFFNIYTCLCFLWIHTCHVHRQNVHFCMHLSFLYARSSTSSLSGSIPSVSIPSTWTRAHVCMFVQRLSIQINRMHVNK